ncbi:hypothetical protein RIF29_34779 [Crotalaria pallida]|uniref:EB1 C-terminal domain-containing protein n=1 Tax=Crotalaria pallida TaxID=3830 RepID=A0AAN9HTH8_CROPI
MEWDVHDSDDENLPENKWYKESKEDVNDDEFDPCLEIVISKEEYEEWCKPWRNSLIVNDHVYHERTNKETTEDMIPKSNFGLWMLVRRNKIFKGKNQSLQISEKSRSITKGSQFASLMEISDALEGDAAIVQKDTDVERELVNKEIVRVSEPKKSIKDRNSAASRNGPNKPKQASKGPSLTHNIEQATKDLKIPSEPQRPKGLSLDEKERLRENEIIILLNMKNLQSSGINGLDNNTMQIWNPSTKAIEVVMKQQSKQFVVVHSSDPPDLAMVGQISTITSMQITELKLSVDSLEKERDFYFAKLRDIEILCRIPEIENSPVVAAIQKILYATDDDGTAVAEAQAMLSGGQKEVGQLSPIAETSEEKSSSKTQKRKNVVKP